MSLSNLIKLTNEVRNLLKREGTPGTKQRGHLSAQGGTSTLDGYGLLVDDSTSPTSNAADATGTSVKFVTSGGGADVDAARAIGPVCVIGANPLLSTRFALASGTANRILAGLSAVSAPAADDAINTIGLQKRAGDTNWFFYTNDGAGLATRVDTGVAVSTTDPLQLDIDARNGGKVNLSLTDKDGKRLAATSFSANLPAAAMFATVGITETAAAVSELVFYSMDLILRP